MAERYFTEADTEGVLTYDSPGLYVASEVPPAKGVYAGEIEASGRTIWWQEAATDTLEYEAIGYRALPEVRSITITSPANTVLSRRLGVAFADHLASYRAHNQDTSWPCIISPDPPGTPREYVRLPHLAAIQKANIVQDTVMWELLSSEDAATWLRQPLPEQQSIEDRLPHILFMRKLIREQVHLDSKPYQDIKRCLDAGRYLSILFVYQHADLFLELFEDRQWQAANSSYHQSQDGTSSEHK
jgi:hypothetical protein